MRLSPKFGLTWFAGRSTTLRAAAFARMSPGIGRLQTLEPTQVAGFNQFTEDPGGTRSELYGLGLDQAFGRHVFAGLSVQRRDSTIPEAYCEAPSQFAGCAGQAGTEIVERDSQDDLAEGYVHAAIGKRLAASLTYGLEKRDFDTTSVSPQGFFQDYVRTERLRPDVRLFLPIGFFAGAAATRYDQEVDQFGDLSSDDRETVKATFWTIDARIGWILPKRYGSVVLEGRNLGDREFTFYERSVQDDVIPARRIVLTANFTY